MSSESSDATTTPKDQDAHWQRLETIFRKHQEQEEKSLNLPEGTPSRTESVVPNSEQAPREKDKSKPARQEQRLEAIFRKHQELEKESSVSAPEAISTETESVKPTVHSASQDNEPPKLKQEVGQGKATIFRKEQKQAIAKLHSAPEAAASARESIQPVAAESQHNEEPQQQGSQSSGMIYRKPQAQATAKSFDSPEAMISKTDAAEPALHATSQEHERQKQNDQQQNVQAIQREPQQQEAKPVHSPEKKISHPESAEGVQPGAVQEKEKPSFQQRVWHGLRSIFRKPQAPNEAKTDRAAEPTESEIATAEPTLPQPRRQTDESARSGETGEHSVPLQPSTTAVLSTGSVQRSTENVQVKAQPPETNLPERSQAPLSLPADAQPKAEAEPPPSIPDDSLEEAAPELLDHSPSMEQIQVQPTPLEFAWNVQRVDTPESPRREPIAPQHAGTDPRVESVLSKKPDEAGEQKVNINKPIGSGEPQMHITGIENLRPTDQPSFEESRRPVEILPPSRPRPVQASIKPTNPTVQRQPENRNATEESEQPALVSTAIGPLPADLWSLLGQEPPSGGHEPEMRDNASTTRGFRQQEITMDQKNLPSPHASDSEEKSVKTVDVPTVLQRQALPKDSATPTDQEQAQVPQAQETSQGEPDLDVLAHQVYAEVRRRLATEWERTRRLV